MRVHAMRAILLVPVLTGAALADANPVIGQKDKQFSQESVTVQRGASVRFFNDDTVNHNISVREPSGSSRPGIAEKPGEHADITFDAAGRYSVLCLIHPKMKMTVQAE